MAGRGADRRHAAVTEGTRFPGLTVSAMSLRLCDLATRLDVAASAGFAAVGLRLSDYRDARESGLSDRDMVAMIADHGLRVDEMEAMWDWVAAGHDASAAARRDEDDLLHVAELFQCPRINAPAFFSHPLADVVGGFSRLCDRGAERGASIGLEFLPYTQVSHLTFAAQVVMDAARPNGGVLLDAWHFFRSGSQIQQLAALDASVLLAVQINDVLPVPAFDLQHEARHRRQLPGEGAGNLTELLRVLISSGFRGPVAVEVFSDALDDAPPAAAAERLMAATTRVLELVGWPAPGRRGGSVAGG